MKTILNFLLKVLVTRFYIINAGFFLFIFFVFFGMVHGGQLVAYHQSLILGMISSRVFMGFVWVAWLLYDIKCILFCTATVKAADSSYLNALKGVPTLQQIIVYFFISTLQYMPVLAYSFFVVLMAANRLMWPTVFLVTTFQALMLLVAAGVLFIAINKNRASPVIEKLIAAFTVHRKISLGYYGLLAGNTWYNRRIAFVLVKAFSLLLLSVSFVRNSDHFDADLFSIFFQLIFIAYAIIVFYCVDFSETQLQFSRNLPLNLYKIAAAYIFTFAMMMLPELAFMLINNHGNLPVIEIVILYGTAVSVLFLYTAILYGCGLNMDNFMLLVFVSFLMIFFLQKTELHLLTMLAILLTAMVAFSTNYYSFERE